MWRPGNQVRLVTGERGRAAVEGRLDEIRTGLADVEAAMLDEQGGEADASRIRRGLTRRLVVLGGLMDTFEPTLLLRGPLTPTRRVSAMFTSYMSMLDRYLRYSQALGLERRAKPAMTLEQWIAAQQPTQAPPETSAPEATQDTAGSGEASQSLEPSTTDGTVDQ